MLEQGSLKLPKIICNCRLIPLSSDQLEDEKLISSGSDDEEELDEDEEGLHISLNQTQPHFYQTSPNCIAEKRVSKVSKIFERLRLPGLKMAHK